MEKTKPILQRTYDAPIERVWTAITDPAREEELCFPMASADPGGVLEMGPCWQIIEIIPGRKISYEWRVENFPGNSLVTFELTPEGDNTHLTVTILK